MVTVKFNPFWLHDPGSFHLCYLVGILPNGSLCEHAYVPGSEPWFLFEFWPDEKPTPLESLEPLSVYEFEFFITDGEQYVIIALAPDGLEFKIIPPDPVEGYAKRKSPAFNIDDQAIIKKKMADYLLGACDT